MDASYAWHPGARGVKPVWAMPVPLLPDEIMSSWLVRAALTQGCNPLALTGFIWPEWRAWSVDLDRMIPSDRLYPLCQMSGIESAAFQAAMLLPMATRIADAEPDRMRTWPWVLALGARNTRRRSGLQYCPGCFVEDRDPFYRVQWRFAWHTGCERHGCGLLDRCGHCDAALEPHRLLAGDRHLAVCATCKGDLTAVEKPQWSDLARQFQNETDRALLSGTGVAFGRGLLCDEWFSLANFMVGLVRRASQRDTGALVDFIGAMGVKAAPSPAFPVGADVEKMCVNGRQQLFGVAQCLISADYFSVAEAARKANLTRQGLLSGRTSVPPLIIEIAGGLDDKVRPSGRKTPRRITGPRPRYIVKGMMTRLERRLRIK